MIEIKSWDDRVLYTAQTATDVRAALVEAAKAGADLSGADLSRSNLSRVNLSRADLSRSNLSRVNLSRADLSGANLHGADLSRADLSRANLHGADLSRADLSRADLSGANLHGADLYGANLHGANLSGANLYGADLYGANLHGANLSGANLSGANGVNPYLTTPLHLLSDQPGPIRAYKLVDADGKSPIQSSGKLTYKIGKTLTCKSANTDPTVQCAEGINLASLDWCMRKWCQGWRILLVEFTAADIAAIPAGSDGKFRVHRCTVVGEKSLEDIGLVPAPGTTVAS